MVFQSLACVGSAVYQEQPC